MVVRTRNVVVVAALALLVAAGCGKSSTSQGAIGFLRTEKASGAFPNLPSTPEFLATIDFPQPVGENAPTGGHMHPPGFVIGLTGDARVDVPGPPATTIDVFPGQVLFAPPFVHHSHSNPGPGPNDWLFMGPRAEDVRNMPLPSPEAQLIFNSADLTGMVAGANYMLSLDQDTIRPGGQSGIQKQGGPTEIYALEGNMIINEVGEAGQAPIVLTWGHAMFLPMGAIWQVVNPFKGSDGQSQLLVMTQWRQGQPSDTPVNSANF
jgi:hypothetical protein